MYLRFEVLRVLIKLGDHRHLPHQCNRLRRRHPSLLLRLFEIKITSKTKKDKRGVRQTQRICCWQTSMDSTKIMCQFLPAGHLLVSQVSLGQLPSSTVPQSQYATHSGSPLSPPNLSSCSPSLATTLATVCQEPFHHCFCVFLK